MLSLRSLIYLWYTLVLTTLSFTAQNVLLIDEDQLRAYGLVDVMFAFWPCQGLFMVEN